MKTSRLDELRQRVAHIGARQTAHWQQLPKLADRLEEELGEYLGDRNSVALCNAHGEFSFKGGSYRHEGLGFEGGRFRIPLMIRIKNLKDEGDLQVRIRLYVSVDNSGLSAALHGAAPLKFTESKLEPLLEYIFKYLKALFAEDRWFEHPNTDYAGTEIGFISNTK
jgi:hypothetical protein